MSYGKLFLTVPAIGAYLICGKSYGFYQVVHSVIAEGGKAQVLTYLVYHFLIFFTFGINVFLERIVVGYLTLKLCNYTSGYQLHFGGGA